MVSIIKHIEKRFPHNNLDIFGKDSLLMTCLPYYILVFISTITLFLTKPNPFPFILIIYAAIPLMDEFFSLDQRNPSEK